MITKAYVLQAVDALPDDATIRDAIEHLEEIEQTEQHVAHAASRTNGTTAPDSPKPRHEPMTKDQLAERIRALPADATIEDAIERLQFIKLIEERIAYADAHPEARISQAEAKRRFAQ